MLLTTHTHTHTHTHTQLVKSPECADVKVFGTDIILSTLMTCSRSKYSWDIVATRIGQHLFFDKRDDSQFGEIQNPSSLNACKTC